MASNMFLYWGSGSVACWKPMIVLEEKNLQGYNNKCLSFEKREHKGEEILKLNPRGEVPVFIDGDVVISESGAICEYLEYKFSDQGTRLLPKDAAQRTKVLQRTYESQNLTKTLIEGILSYFCSTKPEDVDEANLNTKKKEAREELQRWENYLKEQGEGMNMAGKDFTMADVFVYPLLAFGVRGKLDLSPFPFLNNYYQRLLERPSVKATWPPHWKEQEGKDFFEGV